MKLRLALEQDRQRCLDIFDSNVPEFFALRERILFEKYLDSSPPDFYVVEDPDGQITACGGFEPRPAKQATKLRWGMVHKEHHRKGAGRFLVFARLERIITRHFFSRVLVDTSQFSAGFYQKLGFSIRQITQDGIAPGFDDVELELVLDPAFVRDSGRL